ncbi:MAG TPA: complex I subunit 1 family protein [Nitrososphaerales archaeon]|nr:complex I subunit 1 family protein [Nitrososphaerales archaeon]
MNLLQVSQLLLFPGLTFFVWLAFLFEWLDRKTSARMQGRLGPVVTGPFGILQPVADFFKLASKEEIIPAHSDTFVLRWGPALYFAAPAIGIAFIPVLGFQGILNHPLDLLFMLFILAFSTLMAAMLGYASAGRFSTIAVGRLVVQYTSYEVPLILSMITPAILAKSYSIQGIASAQGSMWYIVLAPIAFAVFIIAALAELEKPPFDIPSAKTEIVGGWMTEFSGNTLAYVKLTKSLSYVFLSALAVSLFLGGPSGPVVSSAAYVQSVFYAIYFLVKLFAVGFLIFAIKTALARVRIDQATRLFWTIITPLSLAQLAVAIVLVFR